MPLGTTSLTLTAEQFALLQRYPRHTGLLRQLGITIPPEGMVVVGKDGIRVLVPQRPPVLLTQAS
jgi:hypothetical protein